MLSLKEYVKESLLDSPNKIIKKQDKAFIQEVKNWVKTNVSKGSGRIKVDPKTGEITLPSNTYVNIKCPVVKGATFAAFEPNNIWLTGATETDIASICKNIDKKHEYSLRSQYMEASRLPEELDGMSGELMIEKIRHKLDFNNINLTLSKFYIECNGKVSGTKNINLISKHNNYFYINDAIMEDDLGVIDAPKGEFVLRRVRGKKSLLSGLKNIMSLTLDKCSEFDLSKCNCEYLRLEGIDDSFNYDLLPKKLESLVIETSEDYSSFDLSKIKSKVEFLKINGAQVDLNVSPEEREALYDFGGMQSGKVNEVPSNLINYIAKNAKQVKDFDAMENGRDYITLSRRLHKKGSKEFEDMSYFENFQKVEKDRSAMGRGIEIETEGWVSSWSKDANHKWQKYKAGGYQGFGNRPTEAEPKRFYKNKGDVYYIDYYMIFEIPSSFKPFIERIMK
jgi:hypothetical protein